MNRAVILEKAEERLAKAADHRRRKGRPYVTLSYAQSLDGSIASAPDKQLLISGKESQVLVHKLRALHDAILVGIGTVLADNPRLDVRLTSGKNPQPVVLDSRSRLPLNAHLLEKGEFPPWIMTGEHADRENLEALETAGARVFQLPLDEDGKIRLDQMVALLGELGVNSLMVEGGAEIITHFLNARLVDQLVLTSAPILIDGLRGISGLKLRDGVSFPRLMNITCQLFGQDIVVRGDIEWHAL